MYMYTYIERGREREREREIVWDVLLLGVEGEVADEDGPDRLPLRLAGRRDT